MSKCIGGVAHDAVGSLATHQPSKSFGELFEEKKAQLDTLQAGLAGAVLPKMPPMLAVKYRDSTLKGTSIIILAYPYRYITRKLNVWARELDIYGRTRSEVGEIGFIPFLNQGQYLDRETGLAYNRFRYYSPETGAYISQDPIRLEAGLSNLYAYVHDVNAWIDPWGLIKYIVYQAPELDATGNPIGKIYTGRTSGADEMSVDQILSKRKSGHHRKNIGSLAPVYETDSYKAVRGGEQYYIEEAQKSGNAVDQINGISPRKANKNGYEEDFANPQNNKTGVLDDNLPQKHH